MRRDKRRVLSPEGRRAISEAAKKRWKRVHNAKKAAQARWKKAREEAAERAVKTARTVVVIGGESRLILQGVRGNEYILTFRYDGRLKPLARKIRALLTNAARNGAFNS